MAKASAVRADRRLRRAFSGSAQSTSRIAGFDGFPDDAQEVGFQVFFHFTYQV
ncbi:hypothetical protein [Nonomuraea solani]|uniref:hypothetical protein n=1 Tax=Nonomuraea solani TaxID=1144553 RepID=UPI00135AC98C|nr:hypothetical protein [Nonomuraea solani]